jgi:hypothetical protein
VPAGVPLLFQLLDGDGMALMTMRSQTHVAPGEVLGCVGCHEPRASTAPPSRGTLLRGAVPLEPPAGPQYPGGLSFERTVQPVLDRYCIRCHGLTQTAADLCLLGTPTGSFSLAYEALVGRDGLVALARANQETDASSPGDYYARQGHLAAHLQGPHRDRAVLDRESWQRLIDWLDLNGQYYGDYSWNRPERQPPSTVAEVALREGIAGRCGSCHAGLASQPLAALVNLALPDESRVASACLALPSGGWGQCRGLTWQRDSEDYRSMLDAVRAVAGSGGPGNTPVGTCGLHPCRCGGCWVEGVERQRLEARRR